jgi:GntR family transcriptional regulator
MHLGVPGGAQGCIRKVRDTCRYLGCGGVSIDYEGPVPVYQQVAAWVRERIESGEYPENRPIPSKRSLQEELGVSQGSIERALDVLRDEGRIVSVMGRGLYVTPRSQWRAPGQP